MGVLEIVSISLLTLSELLVFVINGLANSPYGRKFGFLNNTAEVSKEFTTQVRNDYYSTIKTFYVSMVPPQITPAGYTFAIWGVIYLWDTLWIVYGWSFVCRPNTQRSIFLVVYWLRVLINVLNVTWLYVWCNKIIIGACVVLYAFAILFYISNISLVVYFNSILDQVGKIDRILTNALPINGMFFYATWGTIASQINLTAVLSYFTKTSKEDSSTIGIAILLAVVVVYFVLEITIAEPYLRYVFSVYPVLIWACIGVLVAHWNDASEGMRNKIFTLVLLVVVVVFLLVKIYLTIIFSKFRPMSKPKEYTTLKEPEAVTV